MTLHTSVQFHHDASPAVRRWARRWFWLAGALTLLLTLSVTAVEQVGASDIATGSSSDLLFVEEAESDDASVTRLTNTGDRSLEAPQLQPVGTSSATVPAGTTGDDDSNREAYLRFGIGAAVVLVIVVALSQRRAEPAPAGQSRRRTLSHKP